MREEETITSIVAQAQKDLLDIKQRQFSGTSNVVVYESQTVNTWDVNQNLTLGAFLGLDVLCFFVADTQPAPFAEFRAEIQIDNVMYNASTNELGRFHVPGNSAVPLPPAFITAMALTDDQFTRLAYQHGGFYNPTGSPLATFNLKIKFRVLSTDRGTVGVRTI